MYVSSCGTLKNTGMAFNKETVASCLGQREPSQHPHSQQNENDDGVLQSPQMDSDINLSKVGGELAKVVTSLEKTATIETSALRESEVLGAKSFRQSQNGPTHPKPQQKVNRRRNTMSAGFKHPGYGKRRRRANSESESVLPTNFLLGGNIFDPLNLNSLMDEEVNRALNAETPKSSPLPAKNRDPVEILIPRDITDPLNLNCPTAGDNLLVSPLKSGRRRHRNKHHGGGKNAGDGQAAPVDLLKANGSASAHDDGTKTASLTNLGSKNEDNTLVSLDQMFPDTNLLAQSSDKDKVVSNEDEVKKTYDGPTVLPPTCTPSSRQRKRRRPGSKSENSGRSNELKNYGHGSGRHLHTSESQEAGPRTDRPLPNHWRPQHNHGYNQCKKKFQYGNYNKYYGYRNPGLVEDPRIQVMKAEWFRGKDVLDLGCNTGHLTLFLAKNWRPTRIVGLDIDGALIHAAKQNIRHYLSEIQVQQARRSGENGKTVIQGEAKVDMKNQTSHKKEKVEDGIDEKATALVEDALMANQEESQPKGKCEEMDVGVRYSDEKCSFPVSLRISRGPIAGPLLPELKTTSLPSGNFPGNVTFVKGNYVLENDALLQTQKEEYDVVLCLSVTKWVHLNWGDTGLKRLFHRVYRHLRPGGLFILEPQPWASYGKRKRLSETICNNYHNIRLKPDQFSSYLTTEVGFSSYKLIGTPQNHSKGFQRSIYTYHKGSSASK
ncbi:hypothetical protein DNTS_034632 [Danionella cerebrum]|uniref:RNA methyltransferase n=1 Tax=Danionella cerebrum TaxID=2873325 RepID=A0A553QH46_9TELE|nr:hypothetical protein DNTS_034632 [Danionella translucida]TRY89259.1 hypothetical protein DNTS_034632 [Danionella translucida]TRY89260.1 hypothetical protein DNTS_034632 [Danionella translucida]